ncbi:hypothetical protein [Mycobacterium sp. 155]|nr:hypothetical protein [Mycobacterium sp. 155]
MAKYCSYRWQLRCERTPEPVLSDYLAGYGEALADAQGDRCPGHTAEEA